MDRIAVLDSSAILAVIFNEPGGDVVLDLLQTASLSAVNLTEAYTRLILNGTPPAFAWSRLQKLGVEVCFFDDEQARLAGELVAVTRPFGLSLGDRACLALALQRKAAVYTTDRTWKNLNLGIEVEVIR
ncbi:MAG: type II toxin-antitoxin system VapC family toxin [Terracidiphilus sp.]